MYERVCIMQDPVRSCRHLPLLRSDSFFTESRLVRCPHVRVADALEMNWKTCMWWASHLRYLFAISASHLHLAGLCCCRRLLGSCVHCWSCLEYVYCFLAVWLYAGGWRVGCIGCEWVDGSVPVFAVRLSVLGWCLHRQTDTTIVSSALCLPGLHVVPPNCIRRDHP